MLDVWKWDQMVSEWVTEWVTEASNETNFTHFLLTLNKK